MIFWLFLLACVAAGGSLLARAGGLAFRGSTLLGFLLVTLGMTTPLPLLLTRMMLASGAGGDAFIGVWDLWWARTAAAQGLFPLATNWLYYPEGTSLALHTYALTYGAASLPVQWAGALLARDGTPPESILFVAYNLILIASFTLSGYFTYRLALSLTGHRTAAILAGILFAFTNYRFANTVRLHVIATEFLVLVLWAWVSLLRRPTPRGLLRFTGAGILLLYASLEYAAYAVLLLLVPAAGRALRAVFHRGRSNQDAPLDLDADRRKRRWVGALALSAALVLLLVLPFAVELLRRLREGGTEFDPQMAVLFSGDLLDYLLPNPRHPLWGRPFAALTARLHSGDAGFGLSFGWIALALFAVAAAAAFRAREGRRWFWGFLLFWILSLGPALHAGGAVFDRIPLPQALLAKALPFLGGSRTPIRYLAPAWICFALTVAFGWAALRRRPGTEPVAAAGATRREALVGGLLLFEALAAPLPMLRVPVPDVYGRLPAAAGYYALAPLPGMPARESLLYQTVHQQRLVQDLATAMPLHSIRGNSPFASPHWEALTRSLATPNWLREMPPEQQTPLVGALRRFLEESKIRFLILHRTRPALAADGRSFTEQPVCTEAQFEAFRGNLRGLHPMHEREIGDAVLFEFETTEIRD